MGIHSEPLPPADDGCCFQPSAQLVSLTFRSFQVDTSTAWYTQISFWEGVRQVGVRHVGVWNVTSHAARHAQTCGTPKRQRWGAGGRARRGRIKEARATEPAS